MVPDFKTQYPIKMCAVDKNGNEVALNSVVEFEPPLITGDNKHNIILNTNETFTFDIKCKSRNLKKIMSPRDIKRRDKLIGKIIKKFTKYGYNAKIIIDTKKEK